jgi:hypothetical protein
MSADGSGNGLSAGGVTVARDDARGFVDSFDAPLTAR